MKNLKYLAIVSMAICIVSCGGNKKNSNEAITLTPDKIQIKGDLSDYFEVVDKEYTVTNDWGDMVSVEVKRTSVEYAFSLKGVEPYGTYGQGVTGHAGFGIEILDENGNVIEKTAATASGLSGMYSSDDMKEALKLKADETSVVRWSFHFDSEKKPAKFRLTSAYEEVEETEGSSDDLYSSDEEDDDDSYVSSSSSNSEDWDAVLDSYEKYVDQYVKVMKKANNGDMNALSEMATLMEKYQDLAEQLEAAGDEMSVSQMARYNKITMKIANAAM